MMERLKGLRWRGQYPLLLAVGCMPLGVILLMHAPAALVPRLWLMAGLFLLAAWGCLLLPGRYRIAGGGAAFVLLLAAGGFLFRVQEALYRVLIPVAYALLLVPVMPIGGWSSRRELAPGWPLVGLVLYCAAQVLVNTGNAFPAWQEAARHTLLAAFLLFAALTLLSLNRSSLDAAAHSRRTPPAGMRRMNMLLTLGFMALGVLLAAIPLVGQALTLAWDGLIRLVAVAAAMIAALLPEMQRATGGGAPAGQMGLMGGENATGSPLAQIIEKVMLVIALIAAAVLTFVFLRMVGRRLLALVRWLLGRLGHYQAAAGEDYVDEITDTREESDAERQSLLRQLRGRIRQDERGLTPAQRVRQRYRRLRRTHRHWSGADTARETLPQDAAVIYEKTRYGGMELTDGEEERFRTGTRKI